MQAPAERRVIGEQWLTADEQDRVRLRVSEDPGDGSRWFPPLGSRGARAELPEAEIGPSGVAYASTVVRVGAARFNPPYVLTYVDVDGVRVLAHSPGQEPLRPGTRVQLLLARIGTEQTPTQPGQASGASTELWSYTATPVEEGEAR